MLLRRFPDIHNVLFIRWEIDLGEKRQQLHAAFLLP